MSAFEMLSRPLNQAEWSGGKADGLTSNWGQTITFGVEPTKHLEKLEFYLSFTTGAGQGAKNLSVRGLGGLLKRFKFEFNEDGSQQPIVDVTGNAMMMLAPQLNGFEETLNVTARGVSALAASTTYGAYFTWTFNDPRFSDPAAYRTLIPLARARGTKPQISLTLPAITDLTSDASAVVPHATYTGIEVFGNMVLRDIPDPNGTYPYWRTTAKTYQFGNFASAQKEPRFILERGGVLTGILQENFASSTTRGSILTEPYRTDAVEFWYGQRRLQRWREFELRARGDRSKGYMSAGPMGGEQNTFFWDFVSDESLSQTLLLNSAKELTHEALDGGDCYIRAENVKANAFADMTVLKFREKKADLLSVTV